MGERFIIIGGGIAAVNGIKAIIQINPEADIQMYIDEHHYPYNRIKLSKGLFDSLAEETLYLQKKDWYEDNHIGVHLNNKVTGIDTANKKILLSDGSDAIYDKLLITAGARNTVPRISGIDSPFVYSLRQLDDAKKISKQIDESDIIVNIGAGIQGLETAWILHQYQKKVILAEIGNRLMPKQLDEEASQILQDIVESYGIQVCLHTEVASIQKGDPVECFTTDGRSISCDMVIYSAGISPNIEFLKESPLETKRGILVNNLMETSCKNIYAAGDAAEYKGQCSGLWNIAIAQGKTAGYNMAGKETAYVDIVPVTTLNAYGISLFSMGKVSDDTAIHSLVEKGGDGKTYKRVFIEDNNIVGAIVIGDTKKSPALKTAIEKKISLGDINTDNISIDKLLELLKSKER